MDAMNALAIIIIFGVIYAIIESYREGQHANEIDDTPWQHGK